MTEMLESTITTDHMSSALAEKSEQYVEIMSWRQQIDLFKKFSSGKERLVEGFDFPEVSGVTSESGLLVQVWRHRWEPEDGEDSCSHRHLLAIGDPETGSVSWAELSNVHEGAHRDYSRLTGEAIINDRYYMLESTSEVITLGVEIDRDSCQPDVNYPCRNGRIYQPESVDNLIQLGYETDMRRKKIVRELASLGFCIYPDIQN